MNSTLYEFYHCSLCQLLKLDLSKNPCDHEGPCDELSDCDCFFDNAHCRRECRCSTKCVLIYHPFAGLSITLLTSEQAIEDGRDAFVHVSRGERVQLPNAPAGQQVENATPIFVSNVKLGTSIRSDSLIAS